MRRVKKFSEMVNESSNRAAEIQEVVKKLGYSSLEEIKKEKALLTKLEGLMKELGTARDVSEDEAEEIEDEVVAKGEPKSLANKTGEKEEDGEPGGTAEVAEDAAEEIEDEIVAMSEPEDHSEEEGEAVVTRDQEVTDEVPAEADDEDAGNEVPKARIMTFEEFIQEKEVTVNKHVTYQSDEEEPEDYSVPVAASADPLAEEDEEEEEEHYKDAAEDDYEHIAALKKDAHDDKEEEEELKDDGVDEDAAEEIEDETVAMGEPQDHSEAEGEIVVTRDQEVTEEPETSEDESEEHGEVVVEKEITNEKDFEEYAMEIMKQAHPDDFDEEIATKVVTDLKAKYKGDFGAMVGALQSGMGA